jgi:NlpC/P60 family putative phage cell wall peptidase
VRDPDGHAAAVVEARRWIGTPYVHQASVLGAGADCLGLVRGVWRAVSGAEPCPVPAYTPDWGEADAVEALLDAARTWLLPCWIDRETPGDILLFRMRSGSVAKHLGIQTEVGQSSAFVHAYSGHRVVESPLSLPWRRRIAARFAFP